MAAAPALASVVKMGDQAAETQLVKGFYGLENGSWRWTSGQFEVKLHPPDGAAQKGATLTFSFSIPEVSIKKLGPLTLDASIGTAQLKSETYSKPGGYTFSADVPAAQSAGDSVTIDFKLNKSLNDPSTDKRELGLVATAVGLESK